MQNYKKRYLYCFFLITSLTFLTPPAKANDKFAIEAFVNGEIITNYDLSQRFKLNYLLNINKSKITTLKNLTDELLQKQYAEKMNIRLKGKSFETELALRLKIP